MSEIFNHLDRKIIECIERGIFTLFKIPLSNNYLLLVKNGSPFVINAKAEVLHTSYISYELSLLKRVFLPQKEISLPIKVLQP